MSKALLILGALALALGVGACGEKEQVVVYKQGKYQGKPDNLPWNNDPLAYGAGKWSKGDRTSWETQLKTRQLTQHEDKRIYQQ
jgi:hypothetical protein